MRTPARPNFLFHMVNSEFELFFPGHASFDKGRLYSISYHLVQVWTVLRVHRSPKPFYPDIFLRSTLIC